MIRHIFKTIWNERRQNGWIVLEYILIFVVLWFCSDFLGYVAKRYLEPTGFDMEHVYLIHMGTKPAEEGVPALTEEERFSHAMTLVDRLERYPGVESVSLSQAAIPYGWWQNYGGYIIDADSVSTHFMRRWVTPGFYKVFKIELLSGAPPAWPDPASEKLIVVSSDRSGNLGNRPIADARKLKDGWGDNPSEWQITGTVGRLKKQHLQQLDPSILFSMRKGDVDIGRDTEITLRVSPEADRDFAERFTADMQERLNIGPYFLSSIRSLSQKRQLEADLTGESSELNGVISIVIFLMINIFLGIMGTFWFRTQARRSQTGLRMALGASRQRVVSQMITETLLLLSLSVLAGLAICLNIANTDLLEKFGMPEVYYQSGEISIWLRGLLNFTLSSGFLALISVLAVWYPARQASRTQPAEALRSE